MSRIKVVWVTGFSNPIIRSHITVAIPWYERLIRRILNMPPINTDSDKCIWNTNAITEFEHFDDVDLHVIMPYYYLVGKDVTFTHNGVHYYLFKDECDNLFRRLVKRFNMKNDYPYTINSRRIVSKIKAINPSVVHYIGAENPYYGCSIFTLPKSFPTIVQLQTVMSEPDFEKNYPGISHREYQYRSRTERRIIQHAGFIGSTTKVLSEIVKKYIAPNAVFLNTKLALTEPIDKSLVDKYYDFVYFAADISKAGDVAVEAFALAKQKEPSITLDIVGGYSPDFKVKLDNRIHELSLDSSIYFEGTLPSHHDVITQIRKSRFALLPLRVDMISGTIRESMANGLPVITTITPETPMLNSSRESILLADKDDVQGLASCMIKLIQNPSFVESLRNNAFITAEERDSNFQLMREWVRAYSFVIKEFNHDI